MRRVGPARLALRPGCRVDRDLFGGARHGPTRAGPFAVLPQRGARKVGPFDGARCIDSGAPRVVQPHCGRFVEGR